MKIVLLDDSDIALTVNSFIFTSHYDKNDVIKFSDIPDAIAYITESVEDMIVLIDYHMEETNGFEVYHKLKELGATGVPNKKFILFSLDMNDEVKKRCIDSGMEGYINKHGCREVILNRVKSIENKYFAAAI